MDAIGGRPMAAESPSADTGSRRVLLIEDDRDSRETLRHVLQFLGHEVEAAASGREGVDKAFRWRPQAALIDIGLPDIDGYEVAQRLRSELGRSILLIAHTGYGHRESRQHGEEAGFDAYLVKPFDLDELVAQIAKSPNCEPSP